MFGVSKAGLTFLGVKERSLPIGKSSVEPGRDGAAHQAAHAAGTEPTVQGQGGLGSHGAPASPYRMAHPQRGELPWNLIFPGKAHRFMQPSSLLTVNY